MAGGGGGGDGEPEFQIAPMIDVLLVLLVFFVMITSAEVLKVDKNLTLPVSPNAKQREPEMAKHEMAVNHRYDARAFIDRIPAERVAYLHVAGHYNEAPDLIVDTHGAPVVDPVWQLLETAFDLFGVFPCLLERDEHIPPLEDLLPEVERIASLQRQHCAAHQRLTRLA